MADEQPRKLHCDHEDANSVIEALREAALTVKAIGDENCEQERRNVGLEEQVSDFERAEAEERSAKDELESWRNELDKFRLDLITKDELLRETIYEERGYC